MTTNHAQTCVSHSKEGSQGL